MVFVSMNYDIMTDVSLCGLVLSFTYVIVLGSQGQVAGWGRNENETLQDILKYVSMLDILLFVTFQHTIDL